MKIAYAPTVKVNPMRLRHTTDRELPANRQAFRHCGSMTHEIEAIFREEPTREASGASALETVEPHALLVVDGHPQNRARLESQLSATGYRIHTAASIELALDQLTQYADIDLVLLDPNLPATGGMDAIARIRSRPNHQSTGVIVVTGSKAQQLLVEGLESGADDYLISPVAPEVLIARIRTVLRLRKTERNALKHHDRMREDLTAAQELQLSIIPTSPFMRESVQAEWRYVPSGYVGGDVLDVFELGDHHIGFYLADVSGHGVAAAMVAVWVQQFFRSFTNTEPRSTLFTAREVPVASTGASRPRPMPNEQLAQLDTVLDESPLDRYLTAAYGVLDTTSGKLQYCVAGHPRPVILRQSGLLEILDEASPPVGLDLGLPFRVGEAVLEPGDRVFLFTDGLTEASEPGGEMFGTERLYRGIVESASSELWEQLDHVLGQVIVQTQRTSLTDDLTFMGVQYSG
jgi:phosphoserine phosphatase RsbU/P